MGFRFIRQHDSMQCGVACLAMICRSYGPDYSLKYLSSVCTPTSEGLSLLALKKCAERLGFDVLCGAVSAGQLAGLPLPCILHWNQNHFVVLYKVSKSGNAFYVADPAKGKIKYSAEEFMEHWGASENEGERCGIVMQLVPTESFYSRTPESTSERRSLRFLMGYLRKYRLGFGVIFGGLLLGCVLQLILPFLTQAIVDVGIKLG